SLPSLKDTTSAAVGSALDVLEVQNTPSPPVKIGSVHPPPSPHMGWLGSIRERSSSTVGTRQSLYPASPLSLEPVSRMSPFTCVNHSPMACAQGRRSTTQ